MSIPKNNLKSDLYLKPPVNPDSLELWLTLGGLSFLFHLIFFGGLIWLLIKPLRVEIFNSSIIPIEIIEINPDSGENTSSLALNENPTEANSTELNTNPSLLETEKPNIIESSEDNSITPQQNQITENDPNIKFSPNHTPSSEINENKPSKIVNNPPISPTEITQNKPRETRTNSPTVSPSIPQENPQNNQRENINNNPPSSPNTPSETVENSSTPSHTVTTGEFTAQITAPRLTITDRDIPSQLAQIKENNRTLSSVNYLIPLDITLTQEIVLEVIVVIEMDGKTIVYPESTQVLQGTIEKEISGKLAQKILEEWEFEPTYMNGQPVAQEYYIRLNVQPL
jgi:hypothetical protein